MSNSHARNRVRVAARGAAVFAGISVFSTFVWGWSVWVPLIFSAWFALDALWTARSVKNAHEERVVVISAPAPSPGTFGTYAWRDRTDCFGTTIPMNGRIVHIDLRRDRDLDKRKQAALKLVAEASLLAEKFERFKAEQASRQPERAAEIRWLEMDLVGLYSTSRPDSGEVYFRLDSNDSDWSCAIEGTNFSNLYPES